MIHIQGVLTTGHQNPSCVAASLRPDNLQNMETQYRGDRVVTTLEGTSLRSVIASVDDYLMNLGIAEEVCRCASR
ncbi:MAG: hypothetical protein LUO93_03555 [Methanomicrobiales archaeon]|nr:hypothetical protein [Methanomicrobiales archaeon]